MPRSSAEEQVRTRRALLEAAIEEIGERPLHEVSLEDVAKRAGFTKGAIYSNFSSRNELLISVLEYGRDIATDNYLPIVENAPLETLVQQASALAGEARYGSLAHLRISTAMRSAALDDPDLAERLVQHETVARDQLVTAIRTLADRYEVEVPVDVEMVSTSILSMSTMLYTRAGYNAEVDAGAMFSAMLEIILEGALSMAARKANDDASG